MGPSRAVKVHLCCFSSVNLSVTALFRKSTGLWHGLILKPSGPESCMLSLRYLPRQGTPLPHYRNARMIPASNHQNSLGFTPARTPSTKMKQQLVPFRAGTALAGTDNALVGASMAALSEPAPAFWLCISFPILVLPHQFLWLSVLQTTSSDFATPCIAFPLIPTSSQCQPAQLFTETFVLSSAINVYSYLLTWPLILQFCLD